MCDKKEKGIYLIHCIENNKYYIGQTIDGFENRWWSSKSSLKGGYYHLYDLQADWNKYGENAFEFEIVHILKENENIDDLEVYYIDMYKNKYQYYNISLGGQRKGYPLGITRSDDFKKAISEKNRINGLGRKASKETKEKMSKSHIGKTLSKEQRFEINTNFISFDNNCSEQLYSQIPFPNVSLTNPTLHRSQTDLHSVFKNHDIFTHSTKLFTAVSLCFTLVPGGLSIFNNFLPSNL